MVTLVPVLAMQSATRIASASVDTNRKSTSTLNLMNPSPNRLLGQFSIALLPKPMDYGQKRHRRMHAMRQMQGFVMFPPPRRSNIHPR